MIISGMPHVASESPITKGAVDVTAPLFFILFYSFDFTFLFLNEFS